MSARRGAGLALFGLLGSLLLSAAAHAAEDAMARHAVDPLAEKMTLAPAEYLRRFSEFLQAPTVPQPVPPAEFADFWLKWPLITARYKPDGEELRFTYANQSAAAALTAGAMPFPTGAVLTKIGARAVADPGFNSSLIPGAINRIQVMWKQPKHPEAIDGWVYALYTSEHRGALTENERQACAACHDMVPERDRVFSLPFPVALGAAQAQLASHDPFADKFRSVKTEALPEPLRALVLAQQPSPAMVLLLQMPAFSGTLFESREVLQRLTRQKQVAHALASTDGQHYLLTLPAAEGCVTVISTLHNARLKSGKDLPTVKRQVCPSAGRTGTAEGAVP